MIIDKLTDLRGEIILEVAGNSPSRLVTIPNPWSTKDNGTLLLADTACGVGVYVQARTHLVPLIVTDCVPAQKYEKPLIATDGH